ncbi:MAG: hypothetical protein IM638_17940 [Bacteroidetes bacterium]|nr:hypothetical protein [Bacteroidota bacterium]
MVKHILLLFCVCSSLPAFAQEQQTDKGREIKTVYSPVFGLMATFAPGVMVNQPKSNYYLHGQAFVFIDTHVSLRGDAFVLLPSSNPLRIFDSHNSFSAGPSFHFTHGKAFDPYAGFGVGFTYSELQTSLSSLSSAPAINPLFMPHLGFRVFAEQWFYVFAEVNYAYGKHFSEYRPAVAFTELRFSGGLGFHFSKKQAAPVPD